MALDYGPDTFDRELDAHFGQHVTAGFSPGLVYGRVEESGLVHSQSFGVADLDGDAPTVDTVFPIASITKSFVAAATLQATERGALALEDPITAYVPEFQAVHPRETNCAAPTLAMLLSMRGGLTEDNALTDPFIDMPVADFLELIGELRYSHLPGTTFDYSNIGYALVGLALTRAAGQPVENLIHDDLCMPLGLTSTFFDNTAPTEIARATGYLRDQDGAWQPYPQIRSQTFAAGAGMMSTVSDLSRWITWLGAAFRPDVGDPTDRILSRAARREMQRVHAAGIPAIALHGDNALKALLRGYGLGLAIASDLQRGTIVGHGGGLPGYGLYVTWHPESGHGMVSLTNSERGTSASLCIEALARVLTKQNARARVIEPWPQTWELRAEAEQLIRTWDDSRARRVFADNVDFDKPLARRAADIANLIAQVGPLLEADQSRVEVVSAFSAADLTWAIPAERGELICMIHLTPSSPARIQEFAVRAVPSGMPRSAAVTDISKRGFGPQYLSSIGQVQVGWGT